MLASVFAILFLISPIPSRAEASAICSKGDLVARLPLFIRWGNDRIKVAYLHVRYNAQSQTACAFTNSTSATWGEAKAMGVQLLPCDRARTCSSGPRWNRGNVRYRTEAVTLRVRACYLAEGVVGYRSTPANASTGIICP